MKKYPILRSVRKKALIVFAAIGSTIGLLASSPLAIAHEFWVAPETYHLKAGEKVIAKLKNGQNFQGNTYPYNPGDFDRFEVLQNNKFKKVLGVLGDRPAMQMTLEGDGLGVIIYQSDLDKLTYSKFAKFESFANKEGQPQAVAQHRTRGLPETDFKEIYRRFVKSYIAVGAGSGSDRAVGMEMEWVAQTNPYEANANTLSFQLFYKGAVQANTQVRVFHKTGSGDAPNVETSLLKTDSDGFVQLPTTSGEYLINAVLIVEPDPVDAEATQALWYSLWASATYKLQ